ncbi:MAG: HflC protein [Rhodospirillales bacterium 69-11]|nr:protease modulator HflC [Rhodospirillales bacterium]OJW26547.1 MAG: HflC protein [Rhodospirillales bacterium 69-11]
MSRLATAGIALLIVLGILAYTCLFTVQQTEQVLITQFGKPVRMITAPGLHVKSPIQTVISFDRRLLNVELPGEEVILGDQRRLIVDSFTLFRISDPLHFYQAVGAQQDIVRGRLNSIVTSALRRVLGNHKLIDVLSADRDAIMAAIRTQVNAEMGNFGVSVEDVRIRRADLPEENTQAILARMQSERQRVAAQARAEGAEAAARIRADAERERTVLLADARASADRLRGEGEAEATRIYASAFGRDPDFFNIWRTLQGYRDVFGTGKARLVLTPNNDYLRYLQAPPAPPSP